ncbi:hypothetical protein Ddc_12334 [Ditylenchus destructor]|nr:hypothetical protein Ddc_12334 [Ditylenchus destructor]
MPSKLLSSYTERLRSQDKHMEENRAILAYLCTLLSGSPKNSVVLVWPNGPSCAISAAWELSVPRRPILDAHPGRKTLPAQVESLAQESLACRAGSGLFRKQGSESEVRKSPPGQEVSL